MKLLILGPPGSGKGTQAEMIAEEFELEHINVGELLRHEAERDPILKKIMDRGELVPDQTSFKIVKRKLPKHNFILDGFPRDVPQAHLLASVTAIDYAIYLETSEEELIERISQRGRDDDNPETIQHRLAVYERETKPLLRYYAEELIRIDGNADISDVFEEICRRLEEKEEE